MTMESALEILAACAVLALLLDIIRFAGGK